MSTAALPDDEAGAWSISVKTVGPELLASGETISKEKDFVVEVSPEDNLRSLYEKIENQTGLKASQQRLIYRGRLIESIENQKKQEPESSEESEGLDSKIKDIVGLEDGHTIHLVRKRDSQRRTDGDASSSRASVGRSGSDNGSTSATSLLSSLMNMNDSPNETSEGSGRLIRASRLGPRRRHNYRLSSEDIEVPDPGSMEAVRQGLLTMHTLLPPARLNFSPEEQPQSPLDIHRRWFIGQWIDVRDTVNQWLEATIVEIVYPDDILPPFDASNAPQPQDRAPTLHPVTDAIVGPHDLAGRQRLLLEPCSEDRSDDEGGELAGYRRRPTNANIQLLLVHYNGWPHRWDEWIRSDSERLRPFRVRTRHPSASSTALPTPQSHYGESPPTHIRSRTESDDRLAMLPELGSMLDTVNALFQSVTASLSRDNEESTAREDGQDPNLPWSNTEIASNDDESGIDDQVEIDRRVRQRQLRALAPLMDRLGRTLMDAAPHVASVAQAMDRESGAGSRSLSSIQENTSTLGGLLSFLNRDRRRSGAFSEDTTVVSEETGRAQGLNSGRRRLSTSSSNVAVSGGTSVSSSDVPNPERPAAITADPDFVDFATGVVNTTRGEVRSGPRSRRGQSDDVAGLLGAYLAAASLASIAGGEPDDADGNDNVTGLVRLLRERGGGNGGIDIHIHAVVTSPGGANGGTGGGTGNGALNLLPSVGGGPTATANNEVVVNTANDGLPSTFGNLFTPNRDRRQQSSTSETSAPSLQRDEEDMGIFAELYSETPDAIDPSNLRTSSSDTPAAGESVVGRWEDLDSSGRNVSITNETIARRPEASDLRSSRTNSRRRRGGVFSRIFRRNNSG